MPNEAHLRLLHSRWQGSVTEQRDTLGRSTGYIYAKNDIPQQQTSISYGTAGRITSAGFTHQGEHKDFIYSYLPGTHLLHTLAHPNGLTLTQSYDNDRDLPTDMSYSRADALVVQRAYTYDLLGRPTARDLARYGTETQDTFGYNTRSESPRGLGGGLDNARSGIAPKGRAGNGVPASQLTTAHVNSADYSYAYDAIGNRTSATEDGTRTTYTANKLNQYTAEGSFRPTFDADGNQTLIKTSTGTWNVTYNAKNRPVLFAKSDGSVTVECTYDTMGRRATKKVTTNGTLTEHRRFLYRGYLQIAACDLTRAYTPALWYILWDPTQDTATRPLAIQKNGTWYSAPARLAPQGSRSQVCSRLGVWLLKPHPAYGWDLTKNICETYRTDGRIDLAYTYTPYGEVSPAHTYDQPLRWSSEYHDVESSRRLGGGLDKHEVFAPKGRAPKGEGASQLGLLYYNYRHYNPAMGRWMGRDIVHLLSGCTLYDYSKNFPIKRVDYLGAVVTPDSGLTYIYSIMDDWRAMDNQLYAADPQDRYNICSIYTQLDVTPCIREGKQKIDIYPSEAKRACDGFISMHTKDGKLRNAVLCVAKCLTDAEKTNRTYSCCDKRNTLRLISHFECYMKCGFIFDFTKENIGVPENGWDIGFSALIPDSLHYLYSSVFKLLGIK